MFRNYILIKNIFFLNWVSIFLKSMGKKRKEEITSNSLTNTNHDKITENISNLIIGHTSKFKRNEI